MKIKFHMIFDDYKFQYLHLRDASDWDKVSSYKHLHIIYHEKDYEIMNY